MSNRMRPPFGSSSGEQPITASAASFRDRSPPAGCRLGGHPVAKTVGVRGGAAGLGRDQPQALCLLGLDLVAADAQRRDARSIAGSLMQPVAEIPSPRRMIREKESTTRNPSLVGQAISRRQLLVPNRAPHRRRFPQPADAPAQRRQAPSASSPRAKGRREAAFDRSSQNVFPRPIGRRGISVHGNFSSDQPPRNSRSHRTMPNQALSLGGGYYLSRSQRNRAKSAFQGPFQCRITRLQPLWKTLLQCKIRCRAAGSPQGRRHAGARQGQYTDDSICRARPMLDRALQPRPRHHPWHRHSAPRRCRRARSLDRNRSHGGRLRPYTCGLPLKNRDGTPLLQTNRTALMSDKVRYVGDPIAFVVAETWRRRATPAKPWCWISILTGRHRACGSGKTRRAAALRSHPE